MTKIEDKKANLTTLPKIDKGLTMLSIHNRCKTLYYKIRTLPVIGPLSNLIAPKAHGILKRMCHRPKASLPLSSQPDAQLMALLALQRSTSIAYKEMQNHLTELEKKFAEEIELYRDRLEFVRLEIFEQIQAKEARNKAVIPHSILSKEKVEQAQNADDIRLNIGCGHKPLKNYLNIDCRVLPGVDIAASAHALPFSSGTVAQIHAAHLLEHFTKIDLKKNILPYWHDLLKPGGCLSVVVPDSEAMITAYAKEEMSFSALSSVVLGEQDYDDDFHYSMFSQGSLVWLLRATGFKGIEFTALNRINGKCREMEVTAWK